MVARKQAKRPRPGKNSDGQDKRPTPTMSHSIQSSPGKPPEPPAPPGAPPPGATNPLTHPQRPGLQTNLGASGAGGAPERQIRETIQFRDLNPVEQAQAAQQIGLNPSAPIEQVQQGVQGALQQGPTAGPVPNQLSGPYTPPGVESFPDDFAHLKTLMEQGFAPGASAQEHEYGMNARAMAHHRIQQAFHEAQEGTGQPAMPPEAGPAPGPSQVSLAPGTIPPPPPGPAMQSSMGVPQEGQTMNVPPMGQPPAGGIPPAAIAAMVAQHRPKRKVR